MCIISFVRCQTVNMAQESFPSEREEQMHVICCMRVGIRENTAGIVYT